MGARGYDANEEPVHEVEITQDFYLGVYPVTQAQFRAWTASENIDHTNDFEGRDQNPAENMDWHEARQYCQWLMQLDSASSLPRSYQARLPTEAEWEYACSAWQDTAGGRIYTQYHTGDGATALKEAGWYGYYINSGNVSEESTRPVGQLTPNRYGLHDMHGNVWEWCLDARHDDEFRYGAGCMDDPFRADNSGGLIHPGMLPLDADELEKTNRVQRGGPWGGRATHCRAAFRGSFHSVNRNWNLGFRVGLFPVPCQPEQPAKQQSG